MHPGDLLSLFSLAATLEVLTPYADIDEYLRKSTMDWIEMQLS